MNFQIDDPIETADRLAIEVTVTLPGGEHRWCFFMTPEALRACGDLVPSSNVRVHLGAPHMIVVSRLDENVIRTVLSDLSDQGALVRHTLPRENPASTDEEEFLAAARALEADRRGFPKSWENQTIEDFLEAAIAWAEDSKFGAKQGLDGATPWRKVIAFLEAGKIYE